MVLKYGSLISIALLWLCEWYWNMVENHNKGYNNGQSWSMLMLVKMLVKDKRWQATISIGQNLSVGHPSSSVFLGTKRLPWQPKFGEATNSTNFFQPNDRNGENQPHIVGLVSPTSRRSAKTSRSFDIMLNPELHLERLMPWEVAQWEPPVRCKVINCNPHLSGWWTGLCSLGERTSWRLNRWIQPSRGGCGCGWCKLMKVDHYVDHGPSWFINITCCPGPRGWTDHFSWRNIPVAWIKIHQNSMATGRIPKGHLRHQVDYWTPRPPVVGFAGWPSWSIIILMVGYWSTVGYERQEFGDHHALHGWGYWASIKS